MKTKNVIDVDGKGAKQKETNSENKTSPKMPTNHTKSEIEKAEDFLGSLYDFRRNVVLEKTEYKLKGKQEFQRMTERDYNSFYRLLHKSDISISMGTLRGLLNSDFVKMYDPFIEYFENLPKWDGKTDYILELAQTVQTNNDELWQECLKKWLVALVASATIEKAVNHTVIVFSGKQGLGKTTWHMNLVPKALKDYRYSGAIRPDNKDSIINLSECLLINLDELESLNKSELGDLKEMITKPAIRIRRPYGFFSEKFIRRASFTGSVNKSQFLNDTTGSRRFLCFEATQINYQKEIDMDLVYAQAVALLNSGYQYWFDQKEIDRIAANNESYQVVRLEEELLLKKFQPTKSKEDGILYTATDIAKILTGTLKTGVTDAFLNNLGKALVKHRFSREKEGGIYKYRVKRITA
jgi:predicted P-loop ATPase